jgi:hypothetical protein
MEKEEDEGVISSLQPLSTLFLGNKIRVSVIMRIPNETITPSNRGRRGPQEPLIEIQTGINSSDHQEEVGSSRSLFSPSSSPLIEDEVIRGPVGDLSSPCHSHQHPGQPETTR